MLTLVEVPAFVSGRGSLSRGLQSKRLVSPALAVARVTEFS